eukprot:505781-Prymnesium_polylepis.1
MSGAHAACAEHRATAQHTARPAGAAHGRRTPSLPCVENPTLTFSVRFTALGTQHVRWQGHRTPTIQYTPHSLRK